MESGGQARSVRLVVVGWRFVVPGARALEHDLPQTPGRLGFYRAELVETDSSLIARPFDNRSSGSVVSLTRADALVVLPEESAGEKAGASVAILRLDRL